MAKPKLKFEDNHDDGLVELYVDGNLLTTWAYEDDAESCFLEFKKIFLSGYNYRVNAQ